MPLSNLALVARSGAGILTGVEEKWSQVEMKSETGKGNAQLVPRLVWIYSTGIAYFFHADNRFRIHSMIRVDGADKREKLKRLSIFSELRWNSISFRSYAGNYNLCRPA